MNSILMPGVIIYPTPSSRRRLALSDRRCCRCGRPWRHSGRPRRWRWGLKVRRGEMRAETTSVVFIGAGASKSLGLPLTNEIFGEVLNGISTGTLFEGGIPEALENRQALKGLFDALLPGAAGAAPFITDLLSMLDHAMLQANALALEPQQLGPQSIAYQSSKDLVKLRTLLERGIYEVLKRKYPNHRFPSTTSQSADDGDEVVDSEAAEVLHSGAAAKPLDEGVLQELVTWMQREMNASSKLSIVATNIG